MLYGGGGKNSDSGGRNSSNQFKTSVIDTIVAEVQNVPGEDRCVLLLGYTDQMIEMFQVQPTLFNCSFPTDLSQRMSTLAYLGASK